MTVEGSFRVVSQKTWKGKTIYSSPLEKEEAYRLKASLESKGYYIVTLVFVVSLV